MRAWEDKRKTLGLAIAQSIDVQHERENRRVEKLSLLEVEVVKTVKVKINGKSETYNKAQYSELIQNTLAELNKGWEQLTGESRIVESNPEPKVIRIPPDTHTDAQKLEAFYVQEHYGISKADAYKIMAWDKGIPDDDLVKMAKAEGIKYKTKGILVSAYAKMMEVK